MEEVIKTKKYPFVMCNFAPPDMVGHTGFYEAALKACEATGKCIDCMLRGLKPVKSGFVSDKAIGIVEEACKANGYILMVTADHGNAEKMINEEGGRHTAHTCNPGKRGEF